MSFPILSSLRQLSRHSLVGIVAFTFLLTGVSPSNAGVSRVALSGVPYVAQLPNYCGPAALSSLLAFWGAPVNQTAIARQVYDRKFAATNGADLLLYAREKGFSAFSSLSTLPALKAELRSGFPVLVLQDMSMEDHRGHFRVVMGYDDRAHAMLVRDPNYEEIRAIPYAEFQETWAAFGRWSLVVCPKGAAQKLPASVRENAVCHLDLGIAYLRKKQTEQARQHFQETLRLEPRNEEARDMLASLKRQSHSF